MPLDADTNFPSEIEYRSGVVQCSRNTQTLPSRILWFDWSCKMLHPWFGIHSNKNILIKSMENIIPNISQSFIRIRASANCLQNQLDIDVNDSKCRCLDIYRCKHSYDSL